MNEAGFDVTPVEMDLSSRASILNLELQREKAWEIKMLINSAGVSPSQAPVEAILKVDLYGTAVLLEEVGRVIGVEEQGLRFPVSRHTDACVKPQRGRITCGDACRGIIISSAAAEGKHKRYASCVSAGKALQ